MEKKDLHEYQISAIEHIKTYSHCGLFLEMGLGKTVSTLTAIQSLLYEELDINKVLIVAPKRVVESVWEEESKIWEHLKHLTFSKIIGNEVQRITALKEKADIHLISRDNLAWLIGIFGGKMLPFDTLIIDELSSFKNPKSLRFKALRRIQPIFKRIIGLTGTPAPNGLIDLWSQIFLLDRGERLGKTLTKYRDDYFTPGKRNGLVVFSYNLVSEGEKKIHDKIKDICISMKASDYLDLPDKIIIDRKIILPPSIQKQYNDFERDQVLSLFGETDKEISVINAAALSNKLMQFSNGAVYDEDKTYHVVHDLKIEEIKELVEQANGNPILIAWTFRHDMIRMMEALKEYNPRELKDNKDIEDWNDGKIKILLMHPASGGHGLNLQKGGSRIIWFGPTWALELYQQLIARLHRQGQKEPVIIYRLIASKTIDEDVILSLEHKDIKQDSLMEAVKKRIEMYMK